MFIFHKNNNAYTRAKVKPPRLDGARTGLFSTRSPYRPNPIGLSLCKIDKIDGMLHLLVSPFESHINPYPVSSFIQIFTHLKLCLATETYHFKWLKTTHIFF